jgi:hypothetical protein
MKRALLLVVLALSWAGCGSSGSSTPGPTPTSVVGVWDLVAADFTNGAHAPVKGVLSFQLAADGTASIDSCLAPGYAGTTLTCSQQRVCGSGTYTFDGTTLTIQQTGQSATHGGPVTFKPGGMTITGPDIVGASASSSTFNVISTLPTDCSHI